MANRFGAVANNDQSTVDDAQMASIGATRAADGWWWKDGHKLSHQEADDLVNKAGTGVGGQQDWGLGKGTFGDITGGRINDVHLPPGVADALRMAAEAGGTLVGIPPELTGAVVNNIGHGRVDNFGDVLKRGATGAMQGAGAGKLMQPGGLSIPGFSSEGAGMNFPSSVGSLPSSTSPDSSWLDILKKGAGSIGDAVGGAFKDKTGNWDWGKIGSTATGALGAYEGVQRADIEKQRVQMEKDRMNMSDAQFQATYGMTKSNAQTNIDQFNSSDAFNKGKQAIVAQGSLDQAPLRDQAQYMLKARMGAAPAAFNPRDITKGTGAFAAGASGGPDLGAVQRAAASYTPGAGGVNTDVLKEQIDKWRNPTPIQFHDPGTYTAGKGFAPAPAAPATVPAAPRTAVPSPAVPAAPPALPPAPPAPVTSPPGASGGLPGGAGGAGGASSGTPTDDLEELLRTRMGGSAPRM